jgi:hypothetical protein
MSYALILLTIISIEVLCLHIAPTTSLRGFKRAHVQGEVWGRSLFIFGGIFRSLNIRGEDHGPSIGKTIHHRHQGRALGNG